jgi:hypothetical protein
VAIEPADFRKGIDGLARLCQEVLEEDPLSIGKNAGPSFHPVFIRMHM